MRAVFCQAPHFPFLRATGAEVMRALFQIEHLRGGADREALPLQVLHNLLVIDL